MEIEAGLRLKVEYAHYQYEQLAKTLWLIRTLAIVLNRTKNRTLVTCTLSNINILRSLRSACYYFSTGGKFHRFDFYVVTRSYSSRLFLCALATAST